MIGSAQFAAQLRNRSALFLFRRHPKLDSFWTPGLVEKDREVEYLQVGRFSRQLPVLTGVERPSPTVGAIVGGP